MNSELVDLMTDMKEQVEQLLVLLSERERFVIEKRFSLNDPEKSTLEDIGQKFNVTRERVRQIEKNAIQKLTRNVGNFDLFEINNVAYEILLENGGLMSEDKILSSLLNEKTGYDVSSILFVLCLDKRFQHFTNTIKYLPYFRLNTYSLDFLESLSARSIKLLEEKNDVMKIEEIHAKVIGKENVDSISKEGLRSLFIINKGFKVIDDEVGLIQWKHIHPRTLRDKVYFILRRSGKPTHFVDISNAIVGENFDKKRVNLQAVHNELIRHNGFILIGRGIYALKEWGFSSGTVSDVIKDILSDKDSVSEDEIISSVLKQRQVKPITIILNLKNKPQFVRVGRKQYALKK